jgi:peptidoglycan hydrolase CwlO-like protein
MKNIQNIIKTRKIYPALCLILLFGTGVFAQKQPAANSSAQAVKSTAAYAELLLRRAELESDVESFLESYTEEYPKVKAAKYELDLTKKDLARLQTQTDTNKLTVSLGKLLVRKNELETELWMLQDKFGKDHPEVKRAQRKVLSFQNAIKEILP